MLLEWLFVQKFEKEDLRESQTFEFFYSVSTTGCRPALFFQCTYVSFHIGSISYRKTTLPLKSTVSCVSTHVHVLENVPLSVKTNLWFAGCIRFFA